MTKQNLKAAFIPTAIGSDRKYLVPTTVLLAEDSPIPVDGETKALLETEGKGILGQVEPAQLPAVGSPLEDKLCVLTYLAIEEAKVLGFTPIEDNDELTAWNYAVEGVAEWLQETETPEQLAVAEEAAETVAEAKEMIAEAIEEATENSEVAEQASEDIQATISAELGVQVSETDAYLLARALTQQAKRSVGTTALMGIAQETINSLKNQLAKLEEAVAATTAINQPLPADIASVLEQFGLTAELPASVETAQ